MSSREVSSKLSLTLMKMISTHAQCDCTKLATQKSGFCFNISNRSDECKFKPGLQNLKILTTAVIIAVTKVFFIIIVVLCASPSLSKSSLYSVSSSCDPHPSLHIPHCHLLHSRRYQHSSRYHQHSSFPDLPLCIVPYRGGGRDRNITLK